MADEHIAGRVTDRPSGVAVPGQAPAVKGRPERTQFCGGCKYYDVETRDFNDFAVPGQDDSKVARACRYFPTMIFKTRTEWCGQWAAL
jgi:hypothetical protein